MPKAQTKRNIIIASVAFVLSLVLTFLAIPSTQLFSSAEKIITQADIDAKKKQVEAAKNKEYLAKKALEKAKNEEKNLLALIEAYDANVAATNESISETQALIDGFDLLIADLQNQYDEKKAEYDKLFATYRDHLRAARENGNPSTLELILGAKSLSELLVTLERSGDMLSYDQKIMNDLERKSRDLEAKLAEQTEARAEQKGILAGFEQELIDYQKDLEDWEERIAAVRAEMESDEEEYKKLTEQEAKAEKELQETIKKKQEQDAMQPSDEDFLWPISTNYTYISSPYGYRIHPIYGTSKFHNGIDIPAPSGTSILAAKSGKVIVVSYNSGRGYYVVIDHGGNISTLYQHIKKGTIKVKVGDKVKRGQVIAGVGSTGDSTGPHLHFEYLKNGETKDPLSFKYIFNGLLKKAKDVVRVSS